MPSLDLGFLQTKPMLKGSSGTKDYLLLGSVGRFNIGVKALLDMKRADSKGGKALRAATGFCPERVVMVLKFRFALKDGMEIEEQSLIQELTTDLNTKGVIAKSLSKNHCSTSFMVMMDSPYGRLDIVLDTLLSSLLDVSYEVLPDSVTALKNKGDVLEFLRGSIAV